MVNDVNPRTSEDSTEQIAESSERAFGERADFDYDVFISYRSVDGRNVAEWLSKGLRNYRGPSSFAQTIPRIRIYRDTELERVTPAIWQERIRPALVRSRFFLLVLTPSVLEPLESGEPNWVMREVREFLQLPQCANFLLTRAHGPDNLPNLPELAARFPEPGWVDIRPLATSWRRLFKISEARDKLTALAVPALGIADKDIPSFNRLAEREKRRVAWRVAGVSLVLLLLVSVLALVALSRRNEARRQRTTALGRQLAAQSSLLREEQPNLLSRAVLLGIESSRRAASFDLNADQALRNGLALLPIQMSLVEHDGRVFDVAISLDGKHIVTGSDDHTARVWDAATGREVSRVKHDDAVFGVDFSPSGEWVASGGGWNDRSVRVWDPLTGRESMRINHEGPIWSVCFSRDGHYIASGGGDGIAQVWDVRTRKLVASIHHGKTIFQVVFSRDGRILATASNDGTASVWKLPEGTRIGTFSHGATVRSVSIDPDGTHLAVGGDNAIAEIWELHTGRKVAELAHRGNIEKVLFSPNGSYLATASVDGTARIWDVRTYREIARMIHGDRVVDVNFSPGSRYLASASWDGTARVWEASNGRELARLEHAHEVSAVVFSSDEYHLATASFDRSARVWHQVNGQEVPFIAHRDYVNALVFSADAKLLFTASDDHFARIANPVDGHVAASLLHDSEVKNVTPSPRGTQFATISQSEAFVWDTATGRQIFVLKHEGNVNSIMYDESGRHLITSSDDKTARLWNASEGRLLARLTHEDKVGNAVMSRDGRVAATASDRVTVWDLETGKNVMEYPCKGDLQILDLALSPDGHYVAFTTNDYALHVYQIPRRDPVLETSPASDKINSLKFSPDGRHIATAHADHLARIWDIGNPNQIPIELFHKGEAWRVAFSPDGRLLATTSDDGALRIWDSDNGNLVALMKYGRALVEVAFSPDLRYVATSADDDTVLVWTLQLKDVSDQACARLWRNLSNVEWNLYLTGEPAVRTCQNIQ